MTAVSKAEMENGTIIWITTETLGTEHIVIHNHNGPAVIHTNGSKEWICMGKLHREDGPAKELADGERQWWVDGRRHRLDGPAITREAAPGVSSWWIKGKRIRTWQEYQLVTKCADEEIELLILKYGQVI